jgi:hypothetical protein
MTYLISWLFTSTFKLFSSIKLKGETCDQAQIKHSDDSDLIHSVNITELDLDKNGTVKHRDVCRIMSTVWQKSRCFTVPFLSKSNSVIFTL